MTDNLGGVDFSQYPNWETITAPTGAVYYVVPGTGYVYDPFLSSQKGRPVLWQNPKPAVEEKKKAEKKAEEASSPVGQLLPVAGTVGGAVLANQLINRLSPATAQEKLAEAQIKALDKLGTGAAQPGSVAAPTTARDAFLSTATPPGMTGNVSGNAGTGTVLTIGPGSVGPPDAGMVAPGQAAPGTPNIVSARQVPGQPAAAPDEFNVTPYAQGAVGAYQLYQGYEDYKDKNYLGAGINLAGGSAGIGTALGSETAAAALPYAGPIAGAYGGYQTAKMIGDAPAGGKRNVQGALGGAAAGAAIGSALGPVGMGAGAAIGATAGFLGSYFGSSKGESQMIRDSGRAALKDAGVIGDDYRLDLGDGTTFDIGRDGSEKLKNSDGTERRIFETDMTIPTTSDDISLMSPLGTVLFGNKTQNQNQFTAMYTNAIQAANDKGTAVRNLYVKHGFDSVDKVTARLNEMAAAGDLTPEEAMIYKNGAMRAFSGQGVTASHPMQAAPQPAPGAPVSPAQAGFMAGLRPGAGFGGAAVNRLPTTAPAPGQGWTATPMAHVPPAVGAMIPGNVRPDNNEMGGTWNGLPSTPITAPKGPAYFQTPTPMPIAPPVAAAPNLRSSTKSPGISMSGKPLTAVEMGKLLAKRINDKARA